jgi:PAS domain-containing protein
MSFYNFIQQIREEHCNSFQQQVGEAQQRLKTLQIHTIEYYINNSAQDLEEIQAKTLTELSLSIEELQVAVEQLQQQNEEFSFTCEQLQEKHQYYLELFEFAPDGYIVTDTRANIIQANHAAANLLNIAPKFAIAKPIDIFIAKLDRKNFQTKWMEIGKSLEKQGSKENKLVTNLVNNWQLNLQPREKEPVLVEISISTVCNAKDKIIRLNWLLRNLSDRL